ncbi:MAG: tyrosine-type recombinase/integrase [Bdellovibrionales bacterium]|nr:tyrosine-type recombinase/integrase [Bdellovibrionales bacterium]
MSKLSGVHVADYFIKPEDARKWVEWLKEQRGDPPYWRLASFMLLTGARVGEACGMKWSAVDFKNGIARVISGVLLYYSLENRSLIHPFNIYRFMYNNTKFLNFTKEKSQIYVCLTRLTGEKSRATYFDTSVSVSK